MAEFVCDTSTVAELSACFSCLTKAQRDMVKTYLLAVIAGGSLDPATLMADAACFQCLTPRQLQLLEPYLMCIISGGVVPPPVANCSDLSGSGDPTGVTTPDFSGQLYHDTVADSYYRSTGTTSADWTAISGGAARGGDTFGLFTYGDSGAVGAQVITDISNAAGYDIGFTPGITSMSWPNLVSIDPTNTQSGYLSIQSNDGLTSVDISSLQTVAGGVSILTNSALTTLITTSLTSSGSINLASNNLTSISFPALTTAPDSSFIANNNSALVSVSIPVFVPTNGKNMSFSGCALNVASVNHILARCVANAGYVTGTVDVSGGTSAAPAGQGAADVITLTGRGVTVNHN